MACKVSELPATITTHLMPCGVFTWSTTTGGVREVSSLGVLSSWIFHFNSIVWTLSLFRIDSPRAQPVLCGSPPKVSHSAAAMPVNRRKSKHHFITYLLRHIRRNRLSHCSGRRPLDAPGKRRAEPGAFRRLRAVADHRSEDAALARVHGPHHRLVGAWSFESRLEF